MEEAQDPARNMIDKIIKNKRITWIGISLAFLFSIGFALPAKAQEASLYLSPASGTYTVGSNFSVKVMVNSGGVSINAAEGVLKFNPAELEVVSLSKSGSIFNLWVKKPTFSNSLGTINFTGGTTASFKGTSGTIITITFRAKSISTSRVNFSNGAILANDGKGTNVLAEMISGNYIIQPKVIIPPVEEYLPLKNTPPAPKISSPTHPDSNKWYSDNNPKFTWEVPGDITGVRLLYGKYPRSVPSVFYSEPITEKQLEDLPDGIWYFHVQLQNKAGWGGISHFKFQIDTQPPKPFNIEVKEGKETTNPQPTLFFKTTDEMSGIDHYEIIIDGKEPIKTEKSEYKIPVQDLGKHTIIVRAADRAGNETLAMTEIEISPIETPVITQYPKELRPGNILSIKGTALPEVKVKVYIQKDEKEVKIDETKSDKDGNWQYVGVKPVEEGVYQVWVQAIDKFGGKSKKSEKVKVLVTPPAFITIGKIAISYLAVIVVLFALIFTLISIIFWILEKMKKRKKRLEKETAEAEKASLQAFKALKEEVEEQVSELDGKPGLSAREKKICDNLKKALKISEDFIVKEIKDIEKEVK